MARSLESRPSVGGDGLSTHARAAAESTLLPRGPDTPSGSVGRSQCGRGLWLGHQPQFVRCLRIALGSAMELRTHLELVQELGLSAEPKPVVEALQRCERLIGLIIGLIRSLVARP
ncbi:MAG: hypothetical protein DMD44_14320 [Gemmatimonadetes bacterium]|nr:MAG: hypothetical protein DMD44_14320 [Gemmatimonadota bacterium]